MTRILFYAVLIGVLVLGIGAGYYNSGHIYDSNYMSQGIHSMDPYANLRIDPVPLNYFDRGTSVQEVPSEGLRVDPAPLYNFM